MNILVIKQTSLGDVLHSTGIVRNIKKAYPQARLVLLTASSSLPIYQYNPWVDEIIEFDRYAVKRLWWKNPLWCIRHIISTVKKVRQYEYFLAFDLQGLLKSVIFLYAVQASKKYVKGRWWGVDGFHNRELHAIIEMQKVLQVADVDVSDNTMEIYGSDEDKNTARSFIAKHLKGQQKVIVISPFTRAEKKDWSLDNFMQLTKKLSAQHLCIITGAPDRAHLIAQALDKYELNEHDNVVNAAGQFGLLVFAEIVGLADAVVSADSFAVHLAGARQTPVVALFGPTDESKVGPLGQHDKVLRAKQGLDQSVVNNISILQVEQALGEVLSKSVE